MHGIYVTKEYGDSFLGQRFENIIFFYYITPDGRYFIRSDVLDTFAIPGEPVFVPLEDIIDPLEVAL